MSRGPRARLRPGRARLSRSADFDRVIRRGSSHASRELVLYVFPREGGHEEPSPRLGLSVSRKVGGAVQRNRVKRLLREAFALEAQRLPDGTDAVVVARQDAWALAERQGLDGIRGRLSELVDRAIGRAPQPVGGAARLGEAEDVGGPEQSGEAEDVGTPEQLGGVEDRLTA